MTAEREHLQAVLVWGAGGCHAAVSEIPKNSAGDSSMSFAFAYESKAGASDWGIRPPVPPRSFGYIQRYTRETCLPVISDTFSMPIFAIMDLAGSRCFPLIRNICDFREFLSSQICELRDIKICETRDY